MAEKPEDETHVEVPMKDWIPHPVSDHADLERPAPVYAEDLDPNARAEFDARVKDRDARLAAEREARGEAEPGDGAS